MVAKTKNNDEEKYLEKRFNDFKHYSIVFGSIIAALVVLFTFNYKSQLDDLRTYKTEMLNEIRNTLGKGSKTPIIILVDPNGENIENTTIPAFYDTSRIEQNWLNLHFIIKNIGTAISGNLWFEYFSKEPLSIGISRPAFDEPDFDWVDTKTPTDHSLGWLPGGGFSKPYKIVLQTDPQKKLLPLKSKHPMLIKIYNDDSLLTRIRFEIIISYKRDYSDLN